MGGMCGFVLQNYLMGWSSQGTLGGSLVAVTVLMSATYAMRDPTDDLRKGLEVAVKSLQAK